jgi:phosphonate metabolism-associated iron-containing alcohol dehydrogenase
MQKYNNPVRVIKTDNWLLELNKGIQELDISSPIIVTSPGNRKRLNLESQVDSESIFSDVGNNPTFDTCEKAVEFCWGKKFDSVVAIGGGSAMDTAKVVKAHLSTGKTDIFELIGYTDDYPKTIPSIFLPTTHGTASEVTMWGTVWDMDEKKKHSISHVSLYPDIAILDGALTLSLPLDISIITTLDALSHSFESIWNKNANPTSTEYAISAICSILHNVPKLKTNPYDLNIRTNLLHASTTAGLAFSNTKTAAAHSISYPLTIHYGIPHGVACSLPLVPLLYINKNAIEKEIDFIINKLSLTSIANLENIVNQIAGDTLKFDLKSWGVTKSDLTFLVEQSFTKDRMDNNIIDLNKNHVKILLEEIF